MEFGLWFEPEMVNPDSELFRAHPDWVLGVEGVDQVPFRSQLALDISRTEVADYIFHAIDAVLREQQPMLARAEPYVTNPSIVRDIIDAGTDQARAVAQETMRDVRAAIGLAY
jgi:alpha-galactosidase